ncbi:hypothetical protein A8D89_12265 [Burkholderia cenocepacia]|nr:hypothetical protein A8D89_12265 [Burkholderia cenocepacia]
MRKVVLLVAVQGVVDGPSVRLAQAILAELVDKTDTLTAEENVCFSAVTDQRHDDCFRRELIKAHELGAIGG